MGSQPSYEDLQAALKNECERVKQIRAELRAAGFSWSDERKAFVYDPDPCRDCGNAQGATLKDVVADWLNFQTAALAACAYLAAQAALAAAGTSPERPDAARRLAEAWIALTRACRVIQPVVGPAQDGAGADLPRSGIPPIDHDYVPTPHPAVDACDKRVSDNPDGRPSRQCGRPRREHRAEAAKPAGDKP